MSSVWAIDDGYGDVKGYNGKSTILLPSAHSRWRPRIKSDLTDKDINPMDYIAVETDEGHFLVGKEAIKQDPSISWVGGENKHLDKGFPIILKASLALMSETDKAVVSPLVMGLPVRAEEDASRHNLLRGLVVGTHKVKVTLADGTVLHREIEVKDLITKKQPFGSFCDIILDEHGEIRDREIASQFNVIVDIGARTLNIYTLNALEPIYDLTNTTNHGVFMAYGWVADYIEDQLGEPVPTGKLPLIIAQKEIRGIDLTPVIERSYEYLTNEIKMMVDTLLISSWVFVDRIIFTGGGAEVLKPWLEKYFRDRKHMFLGRYSTVRGLQKYGVRYAKRNHDVHIQVGSQEWSQ